MCGITGLINFNKSKIDDESFLKLLNTLTHRGPDDFGYEIYDNVAIGNRRLAIIDLSEKGRQPHHANSKKISVVLNGEIYNYQQLRENLNQKHEFTSDTDTEVIAKLYSEKGLDAITELDGMFSLAIYNSENGELILARDKLGIKPLYYTVFNDTFIFSSEPKTILSYPGFKAKINYNAFMSYLQFRYVVGEETFFDKIKILPPGSYMIISENKKITVEKYWQLTIPDKPLSISYDDAKLKVRDLFLKAVDKRLISDVPLGAFLSGGLDSSLVVLAMKELKHHPIRTYSISVENDPFSEFKYAKIVSDHVKSIHKEIVISQDNYFEDLEEMIGFRDEPLGVPNEVLLMNLSEILKEDITVVLSGEGADEIFGGYGRIFRSSSDLTKLKLMRKIPFGRRIFKELSDIYGENRFDSLKDLFLWHYRYTSDEVLRKVVDEEVYKNNSRYSLGHFDKEFEKVGHLPSSMQFMYVFEQLHLPNLLRRLDATTMSRSVEGRVPFVDSDLVDFALQLPPEYKMTWKSKINRFKGFFKSGQSISENLDITKNILKDAFKEDLPKEILERKKVGFPVPLNHWFTSEKIDELTEMILNGPIMNYNFIDKQGFIGWTNEIKGELTVKQGIQLWMFYNINSWITKYEKYIIP